MPDIKRTSVAFYGSGTVNDETAVDLIANWLPKSLGAVYRPTRVPRRNATLNGLITWLESEPDDDKGPLGDTLGKDGTVGVDNLIDALLARRGHGDDIVIVAAWPDEPSEEDLALVQRAKDEGILVKNLAAALDDLELPEDAPGVLEEPEAPVVPESATGVEAVPSTPYANEALIGAWAAFTTNIIYSVLRKEGLLPGTPAATATKATAKAETADAPANVRPARKTRAPRTARSAAAADSSEAPPFDRPYVGDEEVDVTNVDKTKYYMSPDGMYRKAKTRPADGEEAVWLTAAEVADAFMAGTIVKE